MNIGIEGFMLFGAWTAVVIVYLRSEAVVAGLAANSFIFGFIIFLNRLFYKGAATTSIIPYELKIWRPLSRFFVHNPSFVLSNFVNFYSVVYLGICVVLIVWFVLYHTRLGLHIRTVGDNPEVAEFLGINVYRLRFLCLLASGFFVAALGRS